MARYWRLEQYGLPAWAHEDREEGIEDGEEAFKSVTIPGAFRSLHRPGQIGCAHLGRGRFSVKTIPVFRPEPLVPFSEVLLECYSRFHSVQSQTSRAACPAQSRETAVRCLNRNWIRGVFPGNEGRICFLGSSGWHWVVGRRTEPEQLLAKHHRDHDLV